MNERVKHLSLEARKLSHDERAELIDDLLASLDAPEARLDALWAEEAERRLELIDRDAAAGRGRHRGRSAPRPWFMKPRLSLAAEMDLAAAMAYYDCVGAKKSALPFFVMAGLDPRVKPEDRLRPSRFTVKNVRVSGGWPPRRALLSGLFYLRDIRSNLHVTPESALALIRGPGEYSESLIGPDPG